jgi:hypothetical protein
MKPLALLISVLFGAAIVTVLWTGIGPITWLVAYLGTPPRLVFPISFVLGFYLAILLIGPAIAAGSGGFREWLVWVGYMLLFMGVPIVVGCVIAVGVHSALSRLPWDPRTKDSVVLLTELVYVGILSLIQKLYERVSAGQPYSSRPSRAPNKRKSSR